jgi:hypothetical protein
MFRTTRWFADSFSLSFPLSPAPEARMLLHFLLSAWKPLVSAMAGSTSGTAEFEYESATC